MSRRVKADELALWRQVAQTAKRMHPQRADKPTPLADSLQPDRQPVPKPRIDPFDIGSSRADKTRANDTLPGLSQRIAAAPLSMDKKSLTRLKRGKLMPEARIDLHGMTTGRAHPALVGFILRAQSQGKRLVLVITGKGKDRDAGGPIPERRGVLRHQVPHWLSLPPVGPLVLQVTQAHLRHGGGGAYYVYLKRQR